MSRYFPLFVNLEGKKVCVFGAGTVAARRVTALLEFGCALHVIAPKAVPELRKLAEEGRLVWERYPYRPGMAEGSALVLAATDSRAVNEEIRRECRKLGIPVNVSSDRGLCDFYFPGLAVKEDLVVGVTAGGNDHRLARKVTERIREVLQEDGCIWK